MRTYVCLPRQYIARSQYQITAIQDNHVEPIRVWRNAQMDVLRQASPIEPAQQNEYYTRHIWPTLSQSRPANILMGLLFEEQLIGYGGLVHIGWEHRRAEVSFLLNPARLADVDLYAQDFSEFLGLIQELAFLDLKLHRLYTETYDIRSHHIAVLEANGFVREGVLRDHIRIDMRPVNSIIHGLLNSNEK